jgi:hypothetical protein
MRPSPLPTVKHLIDRLDASVQLGEVHTITSHVKTALCDLIRAHNLDIPEGLTRALPDHYAGCSSATTSSGTRRSS